jgi:four helix bundle protein
MGDDFSIRIRAPGAAERVPVYQQALDAAARIFTVIELAADVERYYLRDQLDRKSTAVPQLVAQGLATDNMPQRRTLLSRARRMVTDCAAILDMLGERGTVEADALAAARASVETLLATLQDLVTPPPKVW